MPVPPLSVHVPVHNDGTLFTWISEGLPLDQEEKNMPAWKDELTEEERWHLVNYLRDTYGQGLPDFVIQTPSGEGGPSQTPSATPQP